MKVYTSDTDFDSLHQAVDKARKNAKEIKVTRQALMNMIMDHANFIGKMKTFNETVEYPQNE